MSQNVLGLLKENRDEILKAEIGALLFNLGKTHYGFWEKKIGRPFSNDDHKFNDYKFEDYKDYYDKDYFKIDIEKIEEEKQYSQSILNFFESEIKIKDLNNNPINQLTFKILDIMKVDGSNNDFIKKIFFRGCENINSGIDKGSPPNTQQLTFAWISNAFGSFKEEVKQENLDDMRRNFFRDFANTFHKSDNFSRPNYIEIRNKVLENINSWYSYLLSDSRYPINDVTLWDQAFMVASMFKSVLAAIIIDYAINQNSGDKLIDRYLKDVQNIKWCILGIQYDKRALIEKSSKCAYIQSYQEIIENIDNKVKNLIEIEYVLGNEIYRDETGIYFLVPENIKGDKFLIEPELYNLNLEFKNLEDEIYKIFVEELESETFPTIVVTKESRGLLQLANLLSYAKENFCLL